MIPAHDSPLAALAFDASGTKLATASEKVGHLHGAAGMHVDSFFLSLFSAQAYVDVCSRFPFDSYHRLFYSFPLVFHFLSGHSHSCLLNPRGAEAL